MEYADSKIVNDFFIKNQDFTKPDDLGRYPVAVVVGDYIYMSCLIKTQTTIDYDVIYEPDLEDNLLKSKSQAFEEDDYWSAYNKGFFAHKTDKPYFVTYCEENENPDITHIGTGTVLVILNKDTSSVCKVFYFKDTYNLPANLHILDVVEDKVIVRYVEYNYVFEKEEFTFLTFVDSYKYLKLDYLWIAYPFYGYDASCNWHLINFRDSIEQPIYALTELLEEHPSIQDYSKCWYDFEKCIFVFENENERITMDFQALLVKKDDIANIQYKNIGTKYGMCQYLKQNIEPDYIPRNKCGV